MRESLSRVTETREGRDYVESQGAGPGSRRATSASSASRRAAPDLAAPRAPPLGSPHSLSRPSPPGSLKSPRTEMGVTTPGTSGNKTQRRPRGGRGGGRAPEPGRPRGPALPRQPAAALTSSGIRPVALGRVPEPAGNGGGAGSTCSASPGKPHRARDSQSEAPGPFPRNRR